MFFGPLGVKELVTTPKKNYNKMSYNFAKRKSWNGNTVICPISKCRKLVSPTKLSDVNEITLIDLECSLKLSSFSLRLKKFQIYNDNFQF